MSRAFVGLLMCCCLLVAAQGTACAQEAPYKFKIFDIPLHISFQGQDRQDIVRFTDINNSGEWIGNDFAGDGFLMDVKHHKNSFLTNKYRGFGFVVNRNQGVAEIRCPGDKTDNDSTVLTAINNIGQVVGSCSDGGSPSRLVGFVRDRNGHFTLLSFPGADGTIAFGINDLGQVVGQYWGFGFGDGLNRFHGFVWKNGVYTTLDATDPEHMATSLLGINNAGQIIGAYLHHRPGSNVSNDYDSELSFLYNNGNFRPLGFPGAKTPFVCCGATTFPMDISNLGQVIGTTYASDGKPEFFFYQGGQYFVITGLPENVLDANDLSVVHGSSAWGMNDLGEIAGTYLQKVPCDNCGPEGGPGFKSVIHGFFATPKKSNSKNSRVTMSRTMETASDRDLPAADLE